MRRALALALLAAAMVYPVSSEAGEITIEQGAFIGVSVGFFLDNYEEGTATSPGSPVFTVGSALLSSGSGLGAPLDAPATFEAYCVDILSPLFDPITLSADASLAMSEWSDPQGVPSPGDNALTITSEAGQRAAWLYNEYAAGIAALDPDGNDFELRRQRAALQIAIWNVLYDDDFSVSEEDGSFYVVGNHPEFSFNKDPNNVTDAANLYLAALSVVPLTELGDATWLRLERFPEDADEDGTNHQDLIAPLVTSAPPPQGVPEPSSMALLALGFAGVVAARRRGRPAN